MPKNLETQKCLALEGDVGGILRQEEHRLFWALSERRYPTVDGTERAELRTRLTWLLLGNELPTSRDAILLSLIHGCRL